MKGGIIGVGGIYTISIIRVGGKAINIIRGAIRVIKIKGTIKDTTHPIIVIVGKISTSISLFTYRVASSL